ncbi:B-cell receptor CD22-like [Stegastes partitus]|uniref:B-cell receptor CD22-like n=1 Tax=Stegastes partitus TaxID=144197 RepID=A0A9Y4NQ88_9TELE|nr:PREDICTED: B-cell receptor CD22-like [Stegastes partitus]
MCAEGRNLKWTLMLLILGGIFCRTYRVRYRRQHICAVKGSSVVFRCSFFYPDGERVQTVKWGHERHSIYAGPFIYDSELNNASSRFEYIGNRHHNCSLKIHQVEHNDAGKYTFRFTTDSRGGKWTGGGGPTLKIIDLSMVVSKPNGKETMKEGDSVNLTCVNSCDKLSSEFTWFKNGENITEGPVLHLRNMSVTNSGNYTCSLKSHTGTAPPVKHIDVEYGPKNTSASVEPSAKADAGSNVTLICSSHANPPVENYTWFKIYDNDIIAVGQQHEYRFNEVSQGDDGQYFCRATNKHGSQNSSVIALEIKVFWPTLTRDVLMIATSAATLLTVATLVAIRRLSKKGTVSPEADCEVDAQNSVYVNWPVCDASKYNQCDGELVYATVNFNTKRKSDVVEQMDPLNDDGCVIYTTVGRNQLLNPSWTEP